MSDTEEDSLTDVTSESSSESGSDCSLDLIKLKKLLLQTQAKRTNQYRP